MTWTWFKKENLWKPQFSLHFSKLTKRKWYKKGIAWSILEALLDRLVCRVRAVVLLPTRDLALQVRPNKKGRGANRRWKAIDKVCIPNSFSFCQAEPLTRTLFLLSFFACWSLNFAVRCFESFSPYAKLCPLRSRRACSALWVLRRAGRAAKVCGSFFGWFQLLVQKEVCLEALKVETSSNFQTLDLRRWSLFFESFQAQAFLSSREALAQEQQLLKSSPPDILVCTPGRLAEHFLGRGRAWCGLGDSILHVSVQKENRWITPRSGSGMNRKR